MITKINNLERVFLATNDCNDKVFFNLSDIHAVLGSKPMVDTNVKIQHYWNGKFRNLLKCELNKLLLANKL